MEPETEQPFLVGRDLVEFDRRDLPIYQMAPADLTCAEPMTYGAPLDRLFGDGEFLHIDGHIDGTASVMAPDTAGVAGDPLVELGTLSDSLPLAAGDPTVIAAVLEGMHDGHAAAALHAGWPLENYGDYSGADWTFDGLS
jgi:hypothetical protein